MEWARNINAGLAFLFRRGLNFFLLQDDCWVLFWGDPGLSAQPIILPLPSLITCQSATLSGKWLSPISLLCSGFPFPDPTSTAPLVLSVCIFLLVSNLPTLRFSLNCLYFLESWLTPELCVFPSAFLNCLSIKPLGKTLPLSADYPLCALAWRALLEKITQSGWWFSPNSLPYPLGQQHFPGTPASLVSFVPSISIASIINLSLQHLKSSSLPLDISTLPWPSGDLVCYFTKTQNPLMRMLTISCRPSCFRKWGTTSIVLYLCPPTLKLIFLPETKLSSPWAFSSTSFQQLSSLFCI